jgi:hypothetical protein
LTTALGFSMLLIGLLLFLGLMFMLASIDVIPQEDSFRPWLNDAVAKATKLSPTPIKATWCGSRWNKLLGFHLAHMDTSKIEVYHYGLGICRLIIIRPTDGTDVRVHFIGVLRTWFPVS